MGEGLIVTDTQQTDEVSHIQSELTSEGVRGRVCCSGADSEIRPCSVRSTSDMQAVMATSLRAEPSEKYLEEETSRKTRLAEIVQQRRLSNERRPASCLGVSQVLPTCLRT